MPYNATVGDSSRRRATFEGVPDLDCRLRWQRAGCQEEVFAAACVRTLWDGVRKRMTLTVSFNAGMH